MKTNSMIDIRRVDDLNKNLFYQLSQAYEREFSALTKKEPDAHGLFSITDQKPGKYDAWIAYANHEPVGFAVIDVSGKSFDVAEFYITPAARQAHLGEQLAVQMFETYRGHWQVRQIIAAEYARKFWLAVIHRYTENSYTESIDEDHEWGRVYTQRFRTKGMESQ